MHVPARRQLAGFDVNQAAAASHGHRLGHQCVPVRLATSSKGSRATLHGAGAELDNFLVAELEATEKDERGARQQGQRGLYPKSQSTAVWGGGLVPVACLLG